MKTKNVSPDLSVQEGKKNFAEKNEKNFFFENFCGSEPPRSKTIGPKMARISVNQPAVHKQTQQKSKLQKKFFQRELPMKINSQRVFQNQFARIYLLIDFSQECLISKIVSSFFFSSS